MDDYLNQILQQAQQQYPFVANHNPMMVVNPAEKRGYAETYPVGETGRPLPTGGFNKHPSLPLDRVGIEIFKPSQFTSADLAGELLHIDPVANKVRNDLMKTWTPAQIKALQLEFLDFDETLKEGRPKADAIKNATDAALRTFTTGQGNPEGTNKALKYSPQQLELLNSLKTYMTTPAQPQQVMSPFYTDPFGTSIP